MSDPTFTPEPTPGGMGRFGARGPRGRWIKLGAAVLIGLAGFGLGRATGHWGHWRGGGFGMNRSMDADTASKRADMGIGMMLASVDGTPDQKAKLSTIAKAAITDLLPLRETVKGLQGKLAVALKANTLDRAAIEQLRAEQVALMETASKRAAQAITDAAEILSPAQRTKLIDRWQARLNRT